MDFTNIVKAGLRLYNPETRKKVFDVLYNAFINKNYDSDNVFKAKVNLNAYAILPKFFSKISQKSDLPKYVQSYVSTEDVQKTIANLFDVVQDLSNFDTFSMLAYRETQFDENQDSIEIVTAKNLITFKRLEEGERIEISKLQSSNTYLKAQEYGAGVEIPFRLFENRKFNQIFDIMTEFRNAYFQHKYNLLYKILVASAQASTAITYQSGANVAERDIKTINVASSTLGDLNKDKLGFENPFTQALLYCHPSIEPRLRAALNYTTYNASNISEAITSRPIQLIPTYNLRDASDNPLPNTQAIMVLPGRKIVFAEKVAPQTFQKQDVYSFTEITTVRTSFAAGVADVEQCVLVNFA